MQVHIRKPFVVLVQGKTRQTNLYGCNYKALQLLAFIIEIMQTTKENKGKVYEPGTIQTYRNGLRRYFLERSCPPAVDNFDLEKSSAIEFEEVSMMLSMKKKDLKQKDLGNS